MTREKMIVFAEEQINIFPEDCEMGRYLRDTLKILSTEPCDCISREQLERELNAQMAVDAISREVALDMLEHLPSIQPTAKENLVVEDCISRAEAIKALGYDISIESDRGLDEYKSVIKEMLCKIYDVQKANIEKLPPVTPKQKTDVLDKIRAEIKEESRFCPLTEGLERALEIIDKYTAENTSNCDSCEYKNEVDGSNCYECVKGIRNNYKAESEGKE